MAPPCAIVIFGASGDLANRKLIPAIYELAHEKLLDERSYVLGFSRSEMSDEQFRMECRDGVQKFGRSKPIDEGVWRALEQRIYYARADYGSAEDHARVAEQLKKWTRSIGRRGIGFIIWPRRRISLSRSSIDWVSGRWM